MENFLEFLKLLVSVLTLLAWALGHALRFGLKLLGRSTDGWTKSLEELKEEWGGHWVALAAVAALIVVSAALVTAFRRSTLLGWIALTAVLAAALAMLWVFTRKRFLRVLFGIFAFLLVVADFIFVVVVGVDHGLWVALGFAAMQIIAALGISYAVSRPTFEAILFLLALTGVFVVGPVLAISAVLGLDAVMGHVASSALVSLGLFTAAAVPIYLTRHALFSDTDGDDSSTAFAVVAVIILWYGISLVSAAFSVSPTLGWINVALLPVSGSLVTLFAIRLRRSLPQAVAAASPRAAEFASPAEESGSESADPGPRTATPATPTTPGEGAPEGQALGGPTSGAPTSMPRRAVGLSD